MKVNIIILEQADNILHKLYMRNDMLLTESYINALIHLCNVCGWTLKEYWNHMLMIIDANWE